MSSMGEEIKRTPVAVIGPVTSEELEAEIQELETFLARNRAAISVWGAQGPLSQYEDDLALKVRDLQLERLFGGTRLVLNDRLLVDPKATDELVSGRCSGTNSEASVDCNGATLVAIQLAGTWSGTVTFEGTADGGNWVGMAGVRLTDGNTVQSTTGNGIFRFSASGLGRVRIRFSTYTSGTILYTFRVSHLGEQTTGLFQSFSSGAAYLMTTNDYTIANSFTVPQYAVINKINPVAQSIPSSYVSNFAASLPQIFSRMRTEAGGDQRQPFAQKPWTNEMKVVDELTESRLEKISYQLTLLTLLFLKAFRVDMPEGWEIIGEYE